MSAALRRALPWHLAAAWLATALIYLARLPRPAPLLGIAVGTAMGLAIAAMSAVLGVPEWESAPIPATSTNSAPPPGPVVATPPARAIDLNGYRQVAGTETQCPRCGGFDVRVAGELAGCHTCGTRWRSDPGAPPDVIIRSWLHR